jgi:hypothetical protein
MGEAQMTPIEWIANGEIGTSSKTMWCAIMGVPCDGADVPHDPDDFVRCFKLILGVDGWNTKDILARVVRAYPWWKPYIDAWDGLCDLCRKMLAASKPYNYAPRAYHAMSHRMDPLYAESCVLRWPDAKIETRADGSVSSVRTAGFYSVSLTAEDVARGKRK